MSTINQNSNVDFVDENTSQSINSKIPKYQFDTLDCTLEELAVLELVANTSTIKQKELVEATGKSIATIKRIMKSLQDKNISAVKAVNVTANGKFWIKLQTLVNITNVIMNNRNNYLVKYKLVICT